MSEESVCMLQIIQSLLLQVGRMHRREDILKLHNNHDMASLWLTSFSVFLCHVPIVLHHRDDE